MVMNIRILHVHSGNLYGGVETFMLTLAKERQFASSMEPEFGLCFEGRLARELESVGVRVNRLGNVRVRNPLSVFRARRRLSALLADQNFDAVVCHMPWTQAIFGPIVRRHGLPLVFWMHGMASHRHWVERWAAITRPDLAICNSNFTASTLHHLYSNAQYEVVYCPVALPAARLGTAERAAIRFELGAERDAVVIMQASRMEAWKGHMLHLEALGSLRDVPNWICWQIGGPQRPSERSYFESLEQRARELGIVERVKFLGQRSDVARLLGAADIYCQPNTSPEPFGLVFIEALSAGLPVVSTAIGGALEILDESCGILIPPNNSEALAGSLDHLIRNPLERSRLAAGGSRRASSLCDPKQQISRLSRLIEDLTYKTSSRTLTVS